MAAVPSVATPRGLLTPLDASRRLLSSEETPKESLVSTEKPETDSKVTTVFTETVTPITAANYSPTRDEIMVIERISTKLNIAFRSIPDLINAFTWTYVNIINLTPEIKGTYANPDEVNTKLENELIGEKEFALYNYLQLRKKTLPLILRLRSALPFLTKPLHYKTLVLIALTLIAKYHIDIVSLRDRDIIISTYFTPSKITITEFTTLERVVLNALHFMIEALDQEDNTLP